MLFLVCLRCSLVFDFLCPFCALFALLLFSAVPTLTVAPVLSDLGLPPVSPLFSFVNVRDLPPPHNPHKCRWYQRFEEIERRLGEKETAGHWFDVGLAAGREFLETLSTQDRSRCSYHDANWAVVADESVRIVEELGGSRDVDTYRSAVRRSRLRKRERWWLESLFSDPIDVVGGSYNEGQHRGCALRFSGAERVAVISTDE
jgi:hypothetical protein